MQIPAIALVLAERLRDRLRKDARIRQMLELKIIIPDKPNDFPMGRAQFDPVRLGQLDRHGFVPVGCIDQKSLIVRRQHPFVHYQFHD